MAPSPQKEASFKRALAPLPRVRNRQLTETPVVISDGSGSDTAVGSQPAQAAKPTVPTVATVAPQESAPVPSERGPVPELDKVETVPSVGMYRSTGPPKRWQHQRMRHLRMPRSWRRGLSPWRRQKGQPRRQACPPRGSSFKVRSRKTRWVCPIHGAHRWWVRFPQTGQHFHAALGRFRFWRWPP